MPDLPKQGIVKSPGEELQSEEGEVAEIAGERFADEGER
jgi:hypothetical protein